MFSRMSGKDDAVIFSKSCIMLVSLDIAESRNLEKKG